MRLVLSAKLPRMIRSQRRHVSQVVGEVMRFPPASIRILGSVRDWSQCL